MKKHIICLGDSNTHGYCADPNDCADSALARFNESERWTCLLQKKLGDEYLVCEEGLSGRTTVFKDYLYDGLDALHYLWPCLKTHEPVSLLVIMLGTNDVKERFSANAHAIAIGMRRLVLYAKATDCWGPGGKPNILVICPPPIGEGLLTARTYPEMGNGAIEKSRELPAYYKTMCEENGVHFLDAGAAGVTFNEVDFMHLTKASHAKLADILGDLITTLT